MDRPSLRLGPIDEQMIGAVAAAQPNTVVVVHSTGSVDTSAWRDNVAAIVAGFMPGSIDGSALVRSRARLCYFVFE